jgi:hypothetical protein
MYVCHVYECMHVCMYVCGGTENTCSTKYLLGMHIYAYDTQREAYAYIHICILYIYQYVWWGQA